MNVIYKIDSNYYVYPCSDDDGRELMQGEFRGTIDGNAYEEHGIPRYKQYNGVIIERSLSEIQEDIDNIPMPEPTEIDFMRADLDYCLMLLNE